MNGVYLTDEQMLEHYIGLVKRYGRLTAKYRNAICYKPIVYVQDRYFTARMILIKQN